MENIMHGIVVFFIYSYNNICIPIHKIVCHTDYINKLIFVLFLTIPLFLKIPIWPFLMKLYQFGYCLK